MIVETVYKNIIFMKYGVHAGEKVEDIINRKMREIENAQKMFWGYGGTICNPKSQVQPFLESNINKNEKTYLLMAYTPSEFRNSEDKAESYSVDNVNWDEIPQGIHVKGSKYAIVCKNIKRCDFQIDLADYIVPIGNSKGRTLSDYIKGHLDKGCGVFSKNMTNASKPVTLYIL